MTLISENPGTQSHIHPQGFLPLRGRAFFFVFRGDMGCDSAPAAVAECTSETLSLAWTPGRGDGLWGGGDCGVKGSPPGVEELLPQADNPPKQKQADLSQQLVIY